MTRYGETVRVLRDRKGLTQAQVAERAGTTQATLARIEAGTRLPSPDMLARLDPALAPGEQGASLTPAYVLATGPEREGSWLADVHDRVGVFQDRSVAEHVAGLITLLPGLDIVVLPVWPSHLRALDEQGLAMRVYDAGPVTRVVQSIGEWIAAFARAAEQPVERPTTADAPPSASQQTTTPKVTA